MRARFLMIPLDVHFVSFSISFLVCANSTCDQQFQHIPLRPWPSFTVKTCSPDIYESTSDTCKVIIISSLFIILYYTMIYNITMLVHCYGLAARPFAYGLEVPGSNPTSDIYHRVWSYTMLQTVQSPGVYRARLPISMLWYCAPQRTLEIIR